MKFLPDIQPGLLNGWIPLITFFAIYGIVLRVLPQQTREWLYYRKGWSKKQKILSAVGLPFALAGIVLLVLTPLKLGQPIFYIGLVIFALSTLAFIKSLFDFNNAPPGKPAMVGLYRWSRNPQWVAFAVAILSIGLMVGSGLIMVLFFVRVALNHFRILGEEQACLEIFGNAYQDYMQKVPRYFWFL